jgi:transcriptional regulator with PAS, ATPase and Fis domain
LNINLNLIFKDRVGIVADIATVIAGKGLNISFMEVVLEEGKAIIYLEVENPKDGVSQEEIFKMLGAIPDLIEIRFIKIMPHEERINRFRVVLDNISDGVFSIGPDGNITTINRMARQALNCVGKDVVGKNIKVLDLPDYAILECLEGKTFSNVKKNLIIENRRIQYFSTGRPIKDPSGHIIGAVEIAKGVQEIKNLAKSIAEPDRVTFTDIIGQSPAITAAIAFAQKIADTDTIVSIRGGSGTGKELFARAIHTESGRTGPFVPINCAALPEQLLESELFGYVSGAFTGGRKDGKAGLFEIARNGTVFLDEVAEMPLGSQAKILRMIQEKKVRRIGGSKEIPIDARIITATNQNLEQLIKEKLFRTDLYYRINVLPIHIPPLQDRTEDILLLVEHFLFQLASRLDTKIRSLTTAALDKLCRHVWPGNVRELKNVVERAAIMSEEDKIDFDSIIFSHEIGKTLKELQNRNNTQRKQRGALKKQIAEYEKDIILDMLKQSRSIRQAAASLHLSHTALLNKIKKHHIEMVTKRNHWE